MLVTNKFVSNYKFVLVSGVQQSDSVIHMHIFILFQMIFSY